MIAWFHIDVNILLHFCLPGPALTEPQFRSQTTNHMCGRTRKLKAFPSMLLCFTGNGPDVIVWLWLLQIWCFTDTVHIILWYLTFYISIPKSINVNKMWVLCWSSFNYHVYQYPAPTFADLYSAVFAYLHFTHRNSPLFCHHLILFLQIEHLLLHYFAPTSRIFEQTQANRSNLSLKGPEQSVITTPMNRCAPVPPPGGGSAGRRGQLFPGRLACGAVQRDAWPHTIHYSSIT